MKEVPLKDRLRNAKGALIAEVSTRPERIENYLHLAGLCESEGQFEQAIQVYRIALDRMPHNPDVLTRLASLLVRTGSAAQAVPFFEQAFRRSRDFRLWVFMEYADALLATERLRAAADILETAVKSYPQDVRLLLKSAVVTERLGQSIKASRLYEEVLKIAPDNFEALSSLGRIWSKSEREEEAAPLLLRALDLTPSPPSWLWITAADVLTKLSRIEEALAVLSRASGREPGEPLYHLRRAEVLCSMGRWEEALGAYESAAATGSPLSVWSYRELARLRKACGRIKRESAWTELAPLRPLSSTENLHSLWEGLHDVLAPPPSGSFETAALPVDRSTAELSFARLAGFRSLCLESLSSRDVEDLKRIGMSLEYLRSNRDMVLSGPQRLAPEPGYERPEENGSGFLLRRWEADRLTAYQIQTLQMGEISAVCPFTGRIISSTRSFLASNKVWYRFFGGEIFYLLTAGVEARKQALYFPRLELLIRFYEGEDRVFQKELIDSFKALLVSSRAEVGSYLLTGRGAQMAGLLGTAGSAVHHLLCDLSALEQVAQAGRFDRLQKLYLLVPEYLGPIRDIFPEAGKVEIVCAPADEMYKDCLRSNLFLVGLGYSLIPSSLADRVITAARRYCHYLEVDRIAKSRSRFPLFWIGLRAGDFGWTSQVTGICSIVSALKQDFPRLAVIFDGTSRTPHATGTLRALENEAIDKEKKLLSEIRHALPLGIEIIDLIGAPIHDCILWAQASDLHFSPWGASLLKPALIANKRGVIHLSRDVAALGPQSIDFASMFRENGCPRLPIVGEVSARASSAASVLDPHEARSSYDFDWRLAYAELKRIALEVKRR